MGLTVIRENEGETVEGWEEGGRGREGESERGGRDRVNGK